MNVLVTNISILPKENNEKVYELKVDSCDSPMVSAVQTNESIIKCLSHYIPLQKSGGIEKIVALVSRKVYEECNPTFGNATAYEYYKQKVKECGYQPIFVEVFYESQSIETTLKDICDQISIGDVVYIDSAGGQRTISNIIQVLTKILRYIGIDNPCTLYASFQAGQTAHIETTDNHMRMLDLADAMNEFMTTGKADQLNLCLVGREKSEAMSMLLSAMTEFSDKIRLGTVEALDETIVTLSEAIKICKSDQTTDEIETVILNQFLPIIEKKLLGTGKQEVDYAQIINWCLDNVLIQQALTIFVEKIPRYLFKRGFIRYNGDLEEQRRLYARERVKNPALPADFETEILTSEVLASKQGSLSKNCLEALSGKTVNDETAKKLAETIKKFQNPKVWSRSEHTDPTMKKIAKFIKDSKYTSYSKFLNSLTNGIPSAKWNELFGVESSEDDNSLTKKIMAIQNIKDKSFKSDKISFGLPNNMIASICAGYMYVKAIRNQTNHASSKENLSEENKQYLATFGYDFSDNNLKTVTKNIRHALKQIPL